MSSILIDNLENSLCSIQNICIYIYLYYLQDPCKAK